jgi:colanic acid/amylovoran biosynthesis protein
MNNLKIGILHSPNTLNYGSMTLCENAIYYLSKIIPNVSFIVLSNFVEETETRLKAAIRHDNIEVRPHAAPSRIKRVSNRLSFLVDQLLFRYRNLIKQLNDCDVIIVLGGDDISEYYGIPKLLDILLRLDCLKRAGKKVYLLGQSIGPIHSWRINLAKRVLSRMDKIYHRGSGSYNYVTDMFGVNGNSFISADLGFLDLPRQNEAFDIEKFGIQHQRYFTFVPSGYWPGYCKNYGQYLKGLVAITKNIIQKCEPVDMRLVLLPHVLRWTYDRELVNELIRRIGSDRMVAINDTLLPFQARAIIGSSYFVVTQRMHAAISSLQKGVPSLSLSYSKKFSEVIGGYLDLPELVIEIRKAYFRDDMDKTSSAIDWCLQNMATCKARIEKVAIMAKQDALIQIEDLAKCVIS